MYDAAPDSRIAIVGRAGRFPDAPDVTTFWKMLEQGRHAMRTLPHADLLSRGVSRKTLADPAYVRTACVLPEMESFDAAFFGFSPREAAILDPQHRHFLECGWEALEDAGHVPERFDGRIGVYAGSGMQAYMAYNLLSNPKLVDEIGLFLLRHTGNDKDFLPTRLSYLLDLKGPSVAIQTACSTSLVAVHTAMNALLNMECDMALAGGATIELPHRVGYHYADGEILSPDGLCCAFDDDSKGTVFGSGAALLVLRRYADALNDGDDIKAVLLASAINNDGSGKASYLAPSIDGQAEAAAEALALSGLSADDISYIEAHGTGTPIGDPIELTALGQVYGAAPRGAIGVGSVKSNIGHLDTAAGAASLIKVVEALRHRKLPKTLHVRTPNARFDFANSPFHVQTEAETWTVPSGRTRCAAVNSLGVGGTNAHVIVEEGPEVPASPADGAWQVCVFSGTDEDALQRTRKTWARYLCDEPAAMADIAETLRNGRRAFAHRMAVAAQTPGALASALTERHSPYLNAGEVTETPPSVVFLYPGGGAQYPGAGARLLGEAPAFAAAVDKCFAAMPDDAPGDLRAMMFDRTLNDADAARALATSGYAIPALFVLEYAYTQLLTSWGVRPDAILAHSAGEYAGAVASGTLSLADALRMVVLRGQVMDQAPPGAMTSVPLSEADTLRELGPALDIAAVNAPTATIVSGEVEEIEALERRLEAAGHEAQRVRIDVAAHSRQLEGQLESFRAGLDGISFGDRKVPMASSLRGAWADGDDLRSADYWVSHLRNTVRFSDATQKVLETPGRVVIEVGPGQTLGPVVEQVEGAHAPASILHIAPRPRDDADEMGVALAAFGGLWAAGCEVDWSRLGAPKGRRVSVPTYAFKKERHWIEPGQPETTDEATEAVELTRRDNFDDWFETTAWTRAPAGDVDATSRWLVFADDTPRSEEALGALRSSGADVTIVRAREEPSFAPGECAIRPDVPEDYADLFSHLGSAPETILYLWSLDPADAFDRGFLLAQAMQTSDIRSADLTFAVPDDGSAEAETLIGLVRSAPREIPGLNARLVRVDEKAPTAAIVAEAARPIDDDDDVALRGSDRFRRHRKPSDTTDASGLPSRLRKGGTYLITGGTGGIGRELALWLAEIAGARLGLLSRSAAPDPDLEKRVRARGGDVMVLPADVANRTALDTAIARLRDRFGEIHGVIHAAGVIADAPLSMKSLDDVHALMAPKFAGARNLDAAFPRGALDLFAVLSSTSVIVGPGGQADYAGANAAAEAIARARPDGLSIAFGPWKDIGMAARTYAPGQSASADPILGERTEDGGTIRHEVVLDPQSSWQIAEHKFGDLPVLPGTGYVQLIYAAAAEALGNEAIDIEALSITRPMVFPHDLNRKVAVTLAPNARGYDVMIESRGAENQPWTEHATATVSTASMPSRAEPFPALPSASTTGQAVQAAQMNFGPRWHTSGAVEFAADVVLARVGLAPEFHADVTMHPSHPALLDVAATIGLTALSDSAREGLIYAPVSARHIRQFRNLPDTLFVRSITRSAKERTFISFDVDITDASGTPLISIEELTLHAVAADAIGGAEPVSLPEQLLATGLRQSEAAHVFARVFDTEAPHLIVSPVDPDLVKLALTEAHEDIDTSAEVADAGYSDPVLNTLAGIWADSLGISSVKPEDDFFALGGHSLTAVRIFSRIKKEYGVSLPLAALFETPTLGALSAAVAEKAGVDTQPTAPTRTHPAFTHLVPIAPGDPAVAPFFIVHGAGGNILNFRPLANYLDPRIPLWGVRAKGADGGHVVDETIEAMAQSYLAEIRQVQSHGPYRFGGYSGGGIIAHEMARVLKEDREEVERLYFFDTLAPHVARKKLTILEKLWASRRWDLTYARGWLKRRADAKKGREKNSEIAEIVAGGGIIPDELRGERLQQNFVRAQAAYEASPLDTSVTLFKARESSTQFLAAGWLLGWDGLIAEDAEVHPISCNHFTMMDEPAIADIGRILSASLLKD